MKKLSALLLFFLVIPKAFPLPLHNPADPRLLTRGLLWDTSCCPPCMCWFDNLSFRLGFEGNYVSNSYLESVDPEDNTGSVLEQTQLTTNASSLTLNLWKRCDLFATLGASSLSLDSNAIIFSSLEAGRIHFESATHFSWSAGARLTLWECGSTTLGLEGEYFRYSSSVRSVTIGAATALYPGDLELLFSEWQIGTGFSHRIHRFVPYVGAKYSRSKILFNMQDLSPVFFRKLRSQRHWGYACGATLLASDMASFTVEARFGDEKACLVNAQLRF